MRGRGAETGRTGGVSERKQLYEREREREVDLEELSEVAQHATFLSLADQKKKKRKDHEHGLQFVIGLP